MRGKSEKNLEMRGNFAGRRLKKTITELQRKNKRERENI